MSDVYGFAAAVEEMESELGDVFAWEGVEYPCIIGARQDGAEYGMGGFSTSAALEVVVRRAVFESAVPTHNDEISINGKMQKIVSITTAPGDAVLVFACEDANKDA